MVPTEEPQLWVQLPESYDTEADVSGFYDSVYFKHNERGQLVKVSTPYRLTIIKHRVYLAAKERRASLIPFGLAAHGNDGTTLIGDDVYLEPIESYSELVQDKEEAKEKAKQLEKQEEIERQRKKDAELPTLEELLREADAKNGPQVETYKPKAWCNMNKEQLDAQDKPSASRYVPRFKRYDLTDNSKLFVGNIAEDQHEDGIWEEFSMYGRVRNVFIPKSKYDPELNKGFCFVTFCDEKDAQAALSGLHKKPIGGMIVDIKIADSKV